MGMVIGETCSVGIYKRTEVELEKLPPKSDYDGNELNGALFEPVCLDILIQVVLLLHTETTHVHCTYLNPDRPNDGPLVNRPQRLAPTTRI